MNILELDSYNLADAVKFNDRLNPRLWDKNERLLPDVREKLLAIADDFREFLGVTNFELKDITISGSNAAYTYTPSSDIDLHLVVDLPQADASEVYRELFDAKKYQYNNQHNISIGGYPVELYVENANESPVSQGIYSVLNNEWVDVPKRRDVGVDDISIRNKYEDLVHRIDAALESDDADSIAKLMSKIKAMRKSGLDQHGEFGPENLAFKMLRNQGYIKRLIDAKHAARDKELSLRERAKVRQPVKYGFKTEDASATWDGVSPTTQMFLNEEPKSDEDILKDFVEFCVKELTIEQMPHIRLRKDPQWPVVHKTFGRYMDDKKMLEVAWGQRHIMDVLRTVAHELTHKHQHERDGDSMGADAGDTGSKWENEANARAGILMRDYAKLHPEYFSAGTATELGEASGYIPTKKQANDPRFKMALTKDIRPGATGREANKLKLHTDSQGHPALLMTGLANALREFKETGKTANKSYGYNSTPLSQVPGAREDELGNQEATGPEFPPQMPAGTTKIDVSDLTDWYRLGMDISDLDDAKPENYNQGPPQTVIVFPSDEAEQGYLKQFKRLGLKTHDIDPDVEGGEDLTGKHQPKTDEELVAESIDTMLFEINMSPANLRKEAAKTGAQAGMEFEMIVPGAAEADDNYDLEPDYDSDESIRSIQDAFDFFYDGDFNSRRDAQELVDKMREDYNEWLGEQVGERWETDKDEAIYDWLRYNAAPSQVFEILGQEEDENGNFPDPTKEDYRNAAAKVLEDQISPWYEEAEEDFTDNFFRDADLEEEWLESVDINNMTDVESNYTINWPHYYNPNSGGDVSVDDVADEFSRMIGKPVNASERYHGARREAGHYVVEPDGSLEPDDSGDGGLEFVSPPMPIDEMITDFNKVVAWAKSKGCYTNDSTGLHINISVPDFDRNKLDFVKLAILMGDEYVLDQFDRNGNTYAKSAMKIVKDRIAKNPDDAQVLLDKMKGQVEELASRAIHAGITEKYTSINVKDGYIEFRSPGGDWLDSNLDKVENTLLRFTVALSAAMNPEMYREEYLKKLYKILSPKGSDDSIKYFAKYAAGELPQSALKSFVRQAQLERKIKKDPTGGEKYWWSVGRPGYGAGVQVVATSKEEAIEKGKKEYPDWAGAKDMIAKPIRPYVDDTAKDTGGNWGIWINGTERFATEPGSYLRNETPPLRRFPNRNAAELWLEQTRRERPNMRTDIEVREIEPAAQGQRDTGQTDMENRMGIGSQIANANYEIVDTRTLQRKFVFAASNTRQAIDKYHDWLAAAGYPQDTEDYGFRAIGQTAQQPAQQPAETPVPGSTQDLQQQRAQGGFTGAWKVLDGLGREVYRFSGIGNNQSDANRVAADWMRQNGRGGNFEVLPIMS